MNAEQRSAPKPRDLSSLCLAITEHAPLPMATVEGARHIVRYVNPAFCRLMDKPTEQLVGKPCAEVMPEKDECVALLDRVFRTGKPASHTEQQHSKPHPVFWSFTMWPVLADERPVGVMVQVTETAQFHEKTVAMNEALLLGSLRQHELTEVAENLNAQLQVEITARQKTARALSEKARLLDLSNDAIIVHDLDDKISSWNKGAEELYGWTSQEVIGKHLDSLLQMEFPKPMKEIVAQLQSEGHFSGEVVQIARDGQRVAALCRWVLDRGTKSILTSYTDITERKRHEEAVRVAAERFRFMAESMPQKIFTAKSEGDIDYFNMQWMVFTGLTFEQIRGWGWKQFIYPDDLDETVRRWQHCIETGEFFQLEHRFRRKDGVYRWHLSRAHPMRDAAGKITMWIGSNTEIDDMKRTAEELAVAQAQLTDRAGQLEHIVTERTAELTATNQQLEAFVYSIAHDLRAPLRSMQGFSAMLEEDEGTTLSETGRDFADRINRSAQFMDALLQDLLAFSRIAQQRIELTFVNLETVVQSALSRLEKEIQEKNARVEIAGPWPTGLAHEPTLGQVLTNLVSNAMKFVRPDAPPQIRLRAEEGIEGLMDEWMNAGQPSTNPSIQSSSHPAPGFIRVWVEDNGIGIAPEHQDQIFRLFTRLHGDKFPGTGIGLAIVQKGVERMGGNVGLESTPGQGSRFWIELRKAEQRMSG